MCFNSSYLINWMPLSIVQNKSLYEVLFNKVLSYEHLRTLVVYAMVMCTAYLLINLHLAPSLGFFKDTHMVSKGITFLI